MLCTHKTTSSASLVLKFVLSSTTHISTNSHPFLVGIVSRGPNIGGRAEAHINDDGGEEIEDTENIDDNSSHSVASSYLHDLVDIVRAETYVTTHSPDNKTLLLDSCSSANLISNRQLLHNIHKSNKTLHIRCNAGVVSTNLMGYLGSYPEPVWFNPAGIANILSQNNVAKYYRLTMDSERDNAIIMH